MNLQRKETELESAIARLTAKLELVRELMAEEEEAGSNGAEIKVTEQDRRAVLGRPDVSLAEAVEEAVSRYGEDFTKHDIVKYIKSEYPALTFNPKSIDRPFDRLLKINAVERVRKSYGHAPAVYRRT